jgi:hypothetical protein
MSLVFGLGGLLLVLAIPGAFVGFIALGVARARARRNGLAPELITKRGQRAFFLSIVIVFAVELIAFGACVAVLVNA